MVGFGSNTSDGVRFCGVCIGCLTVVLNIFDRQGGGVECLLERSPSEVGMVTPSECFGGSLSEKVVGVGVSMPGVFARVMR